MSKSKDVNNMNFFYNFKRRDQQREITRAYKMSGLDYL